MSCCACFCGRTTENSFGRPSIIICLPKTGTIGIDDPGHVVSESGRISSPFVLQNFTTGVGRLGRDFFFAGAPDSSSSSLGSLLTSGVSTYQYSATRTVSEPIQPSPSFSASAQPSEAMSDL